MKRVCTHIPFVKLIVNIKSSYSFFDDNDIDDADEEERIMEAGCTDQGSCISSLLSLSYLSEWEPAEENWDPFELDQGEGW